MSSDITLNTLARDFTRVSDDKKQQFLILYASELSILMRGYFFDGENEKARKCNESLHRVLGYAVTLVQTKSDDDAVAFIEMIIAGAKQRGLEAILLRAFTMSQNS